MFQINLHSLLLILAINKLLMGFLFFYLKKRLPQYNEINYWAYGSIITAIGLFVFAFYPTDMEPIWRSFTYSVFMNVFVTVGDILFLYGFKLYKGKKTNYHLLFFYPLLLIFVLVFFTFIIKAVWLRLIIIPFLHTILYVIFAIEIWESPTPSLKSLFRWSAGLYLFYGFLQFIRAIIFAVYRPENPIRDNPVSIVLFALAGISVILLTYNLIVIINARVNDELARELDSKNKLYTIISHDLRGPITSLFGQITVFRNSYQQWDIEKTKTWLAQIEKISLNSRFLLENLFYWSRSQLKEIQVKPKNTDIIPIITEAIKIIESIAALKNINILMGTTKPTYAQFDVDMLGIIIRNVLTNAIKFSPENSTITIQLNEKTTSVEIQIIDHGIGIPAETLELINNKKNSINTPGTNQEKGTGVGLLLCYELIGLMKGKLSIDSFTGKGTTINIELPKTA